MSNVPIISSLLRRLSGRTPRVSAPTGAVGYGTVGDTLVEDEINGRLMEYVHQKRPHEMGILRIYTPTGDPEFEFYERHRQAEAMTTGQSFQSISAQTASTSPRFSLALEEIVVHVNPGETEVLRREGRNFSYRDPQGRVITSDAHDPVEKAIMTQANVRWNELAAMYTEAKGKVADYAKARVSTKTL